MSLGERLRRLTRWPWGTSEFERSSALPLSAPDVCLPDSPLVSVIMTSHNSEAWLSGAIRSIAAQTWPGLEIILVDDNSHDGSLRIVEQLQTEDPRIHLIRLERNVGTYQAKNLGIAMSHGDVITFADSDDTSLVDRISRQLEALRSPGIVATTCNYIRQTAQSAIVMNQGLRERLALISLMIKRQVVDDIGWFDGVRTSADYEYFQRLRAVYGRTAHVNVDAALYVALHREMSLTTGTDAGTRLSSSESELLSEPRRRYVDAFSAWHAQVAMNGRRPYMPQSPAGRPFPAPSELTR